jgi:hypothetical protein
MARRFQDLLQRLCAFSGRGRGPSRVTAVQADRPLLDHNRNARCAGTKSGWVSSVYLR